MRTATAVAGGALALVLGAATIDAPAGAEDFGWLSGHWCSDSQGARTEELWLPMAGGVMLALNRTVASGRTTGFEYLRIFSDAQGTRYVAQPGGRPPTSFTLVTRGQGWARFENLKHDFPQRIEYRRDGDALTAEISGPGDDGATVSIPLHFRPCGP